MGCHPQGKAHCRSTRVLFSVSKASSRGNGVAAVVWIDERIARRDRSVGECGSRMVRNVGNGECARGRASPEVLRLAVVHHCNCDPPVAGEICVKQAGGRCDNSQSQERMWVWVSECIMNSV